MHHRIIVYSDRDFASWLNLEVESVAIVCRTLHFATSLSTARNVELQVLLQVLPPQQGW